VVITSSQVVQMGRIELDDKVSPIIMTNNDDIVIRMTSSGGVAPFQSIEMGDTGNTNMMVIGLFSDQEIGTWEMVNNQKIGVEVSEIAHYVKTNLKSNALYNFNRLTSDPTLASMENDELVTGDVGSGTTDGRIWIESGGRVYRFDSLTSYT